MFRSSDGFSLSHECRDVSAVAVAGRQGLIATATAVGTVNLWESTYGESLLPLPVAHKEMRINALDFSMNGQHLVSAGEDGRLVLWDLTDLRGGAKFQYLEGHSHGTAAVTCCAFSKTIFFLCTGGKDGDVKLWGNLGRPVCRCLRGHQSWVTCVAFAGDGSYIVSGGVDKRLCLWNTSTFKIITMIRRHEAPLKCVSTSINGAILISGDESGCIMLFQRNGTFLREIIGHSDSISGICFLKESGLIISSSLDRSVKVWTINGICVSSKDGHRGGVLALAVSEGEDYYVTGGVDFTAKIVPFAWDENEGSVSMNSDSVISFS